MGASGPGDEIKTKERTLARSPTSASTFLVRVASGEGELRVDATLPRRLIGKSPACDLVLADPEVSRRHLSLDVVRDGLRVVDLGSTNGTFVNGIRVNDVVLRGDETITVGRTSLSVAVHRDAAGGPQLSRALRFGRLLGGSDAMRRLHPVLSPLAAANVPVVIEGETGTGKELLAEALHEEGPRADKPFVVFDCTTVAPSLMDSHIFGHERGAFTTALTRREGVFEQADGGTLLIDEIGELDFTLQAKLLRALERSEVQRVGGKGWLKVDVRVIAATRRDLEKEVQAGRFREDLFFRLAVGRVELPPLRERAGDIALLARSFWTRLGGDGEPSPELLARFADYPWPGNVRELRNAVARFLVLGDVGALGIPASPAATEAAEASSPPPAPPQERVAGDVIDEVIKEDLPLGLARERVLDAFLRRYVAHVLAKHGGNVTRAAAASGIARRYFYVVKNRAEKDK
jgi:two-component system, NtrC family, response regulator HydG